MRSSHSGQGAETTTSSHQLTEDPCIGYELHEEPYYSVVAVNNKAGLSAILESDYCKISGEYHVIGEGTMGGTDFQPAAPTYEVVDQIPKGWKEASPTDRIPSPVTEQNLGATIYATVHTDPISQDHFPIYAQVDMQKKVCTDLVVLNPALLAPCCCC